MKTATMDNRGGNPEHPPYVVFDTSGRGPGDYPPEALAQLEGLSVRIEHETLVEPDELIGRCGAADILLVTAARITGDVLMGLPRLRGIVRYGIGLDRIDLDAAAARGVLVRNTVGFCTEEMAEHTLALALACARNLLPDAMGVRNGGWPSSGNRPLHRLSGGCAGIIGLGAIGTAVARRLFSFGMHVLAFDPLADASAAKNLGVTLTGLDELLTRADLITVHCPLIPETRGLLGREQLALCKPTALLVNTSRGGVIDEEALVEALQSGRPAAVGLDVLAQEPPPGNHPLRKMDAVVITPHRAWYSEEAERDLVVQAFCTVGAILRERVG